ncbi:5' nucleotidase [Streptomyces phage Faust]|uniref:5' nucleotidase n=1 Tax=Streptomyces phage Faust TaxID=2767565 RepID=A0A7G9UYT1_9CAUD|nr:unknown function [Streptomyces phage Faust]QNN99186.1 5' nucleotidase [Streptomyces phage Faust]
MRVGIDLDGVCYDFAESFVKYMSGIDHSYDIPPYEKEVDKWHFYRDWGMTDEDFVKYCHYGADDMVIFRQGGQRDNAAEAIDFMRAFGNTIHIVTDRSFGTTPESSEDNTKWWLFSHGISYDTLTFSADKTCVPTDVFIEDKLENYDALVAAGVDCYLVDRPWNQDDSTYRKRVRSIQQFATLVGCMSI